MRLRRRNRRYAVVAAVIASYILILVLFIRANSGDTGADLADPSATRSAVDFPDEPGASAASLGASGTATVRVSNPDATITLAEPGGISVVGPAAHTVVLRVTSAATVPRLGYLVPTSLNDPVADMRNVRPPWTFRTTAYGKPGYAEIFIQAGPAGVEITCAIEVDGKITSSETTRGPYGRQVCIG